MTVGTFGKKCTKGGGNEEWFLDCQAPADVVVNVESRMLQTLKAFDALPLQPGFWF